ncbi:MAG: nuclear transport factor 2 family protein [Saprospiraceae bacterium]|nr:nuclear transport factor 2 family protein [Saprospiraceae bacterium]
MKKANQFSLVLTAAFFFAILATPMSAQLITRQATLKPSSTTTTTTTTPTTSVDVVTDEMKAMLDRWEKFYNTEKSAELGKLVTKDVTISEPDGDSRTMTRNEFVGNLENDFIVPGSAEIDLSVTNVTIRPDGSALIIGTYTEKELDARGNVVSRKSGDFVDVAIKEDGVWKLHEMTVDPN